jgi:hypothetical protein
MNVATYTGTVENGQIRLPADVRLPEKTTVYVVVPGVSAPPNLYVRSPRLVHPEQAADFVKTVLAEGNQHAGV